MPPEDGGQLPTGKVVDGFLRTIEDACKRCPELRSCAIIFDWTDLSEIAQSNTPAALWCDEHGPVRYMQFNVIANAIAQTMKLLYAQLDTLEMSARIGLSRRTHLEDELQKLEKRVNDQRIALAGINAAIDAARAAAKEAEAKDAPQTDGGDGNQPKVSTTVPADKGA